MTPPLTEAALSVWGKTDRTGKSAVGWLPLWRHLADTAAVAQRLWVSWLSPAVVRHIAAGLPGGPDDGLILLTWLAGIHDIGKATPAFACQAPMLVERMRHRGLDFHTDLINADRRLAPHATAGHVILVDWLRDEQGWDDGSDYAVVVGGHHGVPPTDEGIRAVNVRRYLLGDGAWTDVQRELLAWMADRTGAKERLADWRDSRLPQPVQAILTGLVIMADWIASNEEYFPYELTASEAERVEDAWQTLDLPVPWTAREAPSTVDDVFAARFDLPVGATPRPVQRTVAGQAESMSLPGMMIVEAAMGEGKTEAALAAVEILSRRCGASGCFVALPTRATSDAMFKRVLGWLTRLPDADTAHGDRDIMLAHGKSAFNPEYDRLKWKSLPSGIGIDDGGADVGVHQWLAGRKRAMLSSFVVGTIDQLLFAALRSKHLVLRHLGLAGKVVVIDEAHAYDVYMSTFLDRTLEWLGAYGVPVIVLSATLPAARRAQMMEAYDDGRLGPPPPLTWRDRGRPKVDVYAGLRTDLRYPLVTASTPQRGGVSCASGDSGRRIEVKLEPLDDDLAGLTELLRDRLSAGGCALVVRNTVARVQETAAVLRQTLDLPVSVAHSRFMARDRATKDIWLRDTFGPPGEAHRPHRHVVVASQVAEQSLDIDFDLLVTDLAPVDLMLQRIGRLHRHQRPDRPAHLTPATCYVTGADWTMTPPKPVSGSRRVYQEAALLRGAAVVNRYLTGDEALRLPDDIAPLTQAAYGEAVIAPESWHTAIAEADEKAAAQRTAKETKAKGFRLDSVGEQGSPLIGWLAGGVGSADENAARGHVRDSDAESLEVLLLVRTPDGLVVPPWIEGGGQLVPTETVPPRRLARLVASCSLPLPRLMTAPDVVDPVIAELERRGNVPAWGQNPWLEGELLLDIDAEGNARLDDFDLHYDVDDGLRASKAA